MRLIDADALDPDADYDDGEYWAYSLTQIRNAPTIHQELARQEIIRCKDCRWNDGVAYCEMHFRDVKGDDFCSWAERRTDEQTD